MSADHTRLKGVTDIGKALLSEQMEWGLASFFSWGLIGAGGYFNVNIPSTGAYGGHYHRLGLVDDPYHASGEVWQGFRQDWVWEEAPDWVDRGGDAPIVVSGVYVNGHFQPTTGVAYSHHIDYPNGRVVFDEAISPTSVVTCEYSYRHVHVTTSDAPWWRQIQTESYRVDSQAFLAGSGYWGVLSQNRVQLPAMVVEAVPNIRTNLGHLGGGRLVDQDVLFHIFSETPHDRRLLHDVVTYQGDKRVHLYDRNAVAEHHYPLDEYGSPTASGLQYPDMVRWPAEGGYAWKKVSFENFSSIPQPMEGTGPIYVCSVRAVMRTDLA